MTDYTKEEAVKAICSGKMLEQPEGCNKNMYELMRRCWKQLPEERPTFREVKLGVEHIIEDLDGSYEPNWDVSNN